MNTKSEDRLLGLASAALVTTIGGELLGSQLLITVGAVGFVIISPRAVRGHERRARSGRRSNAGDERPDPTVTERVR